MMPYLAEGMTMLHFLLFVISWGAFVSCSAVWIFDPSRRSL